MGLFSWLRMRFSTPSSRDAPRNGTKVMDFDRNIARNETIYAAINIRSNAIASAPITLRREYKKVNAVEHDIADLLERPNNFQTQFDFIKLIETIRCSKGAAYVIKEYDDLLNVTSMWVMDSDFVTPVLDEETKELWYQVRQKQGETYIHSRHIMAFNYMTSNGYTPISPLNVLKNTIEYDTEIKSVSISQMQNGLNFKLAVTVGQALNEEKMKTYNDMISNFKKTGILYLDKGKEAKTLNTDSFIDPHVFDVEKITKERVAMVFNIPLSKLSSSKSSYNSSSISSLTIDSISF